MSDCEGISPSSSRSSYQDTICEKPSLGLNEESSKSGNYSSKLYTKKGRPNTLKEKREMRNKRRARKRRIVDRRCNGKRIIIKQLKQAKEEAIQHVKKTEQKVITLKCMTRTFWERWRWEVEKRKEDFFLNRFSRIDTTEKHNIHEIEPSLLIPCEVKDQKRFVGRGSFGIVSLQMFRGMQVAVKELHIHAVVNDVIHEAYMLLQLSHPSLPFLFGVCTKAKPFKVVMQFHGLDLGSTLPESITLLNELNHGKIGLNNSEWILAIAQLLEAVSYLHTKAEILHNDVTSSNIVLGNAFNTSSCSSLFTRNYQIAVVDFGKATKLTKGKMYHLTVSEKEEYYHKFPQLAPEIIEGECRQSTFSDMYAVGGIINGIADKKCEEHRKVLLNLAENCRLTKYRLRFSADRALLYLQENLLPIC